ncbi:hypothetical protein SCLCIDRAFT_1116525, partial [Scleroderma citrinum Foug A]
MHLLDFAGFRCRPGAKGRADNVTYIQAYTTEKTMAYQHHVGLFKERDAQCVLSRESLEKLSKDVEKMSEILSECIGEGGIPHAPQDGCARIEVRARLSDAMDVLSDIPEEIVQECIAAIPAMPYWSFKWYRLAGIYAVVKSLCNSSAEGRGTECSLALGGIVVWLLNGLHRRPQDHFQSLAEEVCQRIPVNYEDYDPEFDHDDAEATEPLMYSAGVYFVCDVVPDTGSPAYRIPYHKQASEDALVRAFKMSHQEIARITGMNQIREVPRRRTNAQRTNNRSTRPTLRADYFRPEDRALPQINNALDDVEIRATHRMRGEDVTHFMNHGGGNRAEAGEQEMGQENVTVLVQKILEQFF